MKSARIAVLLALTASAGVIFGETSLHASQSGLLIDGSLVVHCKTDDARVFIDGQATRTKGCVREYHVRLKQGPHMVRIFDDLAGKFATFFYRRGQSTYVVDWNSCTPSVHNDNSQGILDHDRLYWATHVRISKASKQEEKGPGREKDDCESCRVTQECPRCNRRDDGCSECKGDTPKCPHRKPDADECPDCKGHAPECPHCKPDADECPDCKGHASKCPHCKPEADECPDCNRHAPKCPHCKPEADECPKCKRPAPKCPHCHGHKPVPKPQPAVPDWPGSFPGLTYKWNGEPLSDFRVWPKAWLNQDGILELTGGAVLPENFNGTLAEACRRSNEMTLEAVFQARSDQTGSEDLPKRIISFSKNTAERNFTLGQSHDWLVFRLRTASQGGNGTEVQLAKIDPTKRVHVLVTYCDGHLACYLDGKKAGKVHNVKGDFRNWDSDSDMKLIFGNEITRDRNWDGDLERVAIGNRFFREDEAQRQYQLYLQTK